VPSPKPKRIFELRAIRTLMDQGTIVICAGGGGIPTMYDDRGKLRGVEAVIDKDLASALLAEELQADLLVIATDVDGVYRGWGTSDQLHLGRISADELATLELPVGSMGPKVEAARRFARRTGNDAVIGALVDIADIVAGDAGTRVTVR
jgi:carbamate kinase